MYVMELEISVTFDVNFGHNRELCVSNSCETISRVKLDVDDIERTLNIKISGCATLPP
jgi:hypothetical protein